QDAEEIKKELSDRNEQINKIWDIIEKAIIRAEESSLSNKIVKIPKKQLNFRKESETKKKRNQEIYKKAKRDDYKETKDNSKKDLEYKLAVASSEVLLDTKDYFKGQFKERCPKIECMTKDWRAVYSPVNEVKAESAAGISNIVYPLIVQADTKTQIIFVNFANLCLFSGIILSKWKVAQIYMISKREDWNFELNKVHLIALLDVFQKLSENSTEDLIFILSMLIEEAEEKGHEM
ncbi:22400_t:CDS:2, partial [Gigaspora margarita]